VAVTSGASVHWARWVDLIDWAGWAADRDTPVVVVERVGDQETRETRDKRWVGMVALGQRESRDEVVAMSKGCGWNLLQGKATRDYWLSCGS
jgi:hypothetical protein